MFLITGLTGHVGGAVARHLLEAGQQVRALVRDPQKAAPWAQQGVELVRGEFADTAALVSALSGVEGAFLMVPPYFAPAPGFPEAQAIVDRFRAALNQAPPPRLVALSSFGSERGHGLGLITSTHLLEVGLADLPFPTAFVRPGSFLENYLPNLQAAAQTGRFESFWQPTDHPFPVVATADIGAQIARLLLEGWTGHKIVELGTPVTPQDLARAMGGALGREVVAQAVPRAEWNARLQAAGFPPRTAELYAEMVDATNAGWIAFGAPGAERVAGTTTPAEFFAGVQQQQ